MSIHELFKPYISLMRLNKPIGIFLLLWPTLTALWIAGNGKPNLDLIIIFCCGVFLTRTAGCVINDIVDRNFDKHIERTRERPLTAGLISTKEALILCGILFLSAFGLVLFLNSFTILLSLGALALACIYPFMKRYTYFPQIILGMAFSWGILMAFSAQTCNVPRQAWLLYLIAIVWTTAYDTMYGMVDRPDDIKVGIKSTAIFFGKFDRIVIGLLQLISLALLIILGQSLKMQVWYYIGIIIAAVLFIYQQKLIYHCDPKNCFKAFLNNNYAWLSVFLGVVLSYSYH